MWSDIFQNHTSFIRVQLLRSAFHPTRRFTLTGRTPVWFNPNAQGNPGGITADQSGWDGLPAAASITLPATGILVFARDWGDFRQRPASLQSSVDAGHKCAAYWAI
jgi:hypothetical protein